MKMSRQANNKNPLKTCLISGVLFAIIIIFAVVLAISLSKEDVGDLEQKLEQSLQSEVTYIVEGTAAKASVTYVNLSGVTEQVSEVTLPYEKTITVNFGSSLSVVAQNLTDSGMITCKILIDGKEVKTATSEGGYVVVSCAAVIMPEP